MRPMISVRPVTRMGIGFADIVDLVIDLDPNEALRILLEILDKDMNSSLCVHMHRKHHDRGLDSEHSRTVISQ